jgi:hypothetical protein
MLLYKENAANCHGIKSNRPLLIRNKKYTYVNHCGKYTEHVRNDLFTRSEIGCKNHVMLIYEILQLCKASLLAGIIVN